MVGSNFFSFITSNNYSSFVLRLRNSFSDTYWPVDFSHVGLWGHHAIVDLIAYMIEFESSLDRLGIVEEEPLPHAKWSPEERVWFGAEYVGKNMNAITAPPEQLQRRSEYAYLATSQAALEVLLLPNWARWVDGRSRQLAHRFDRLYSNTVLWKI